MTVRERLYLFDTTLRDGAQTTGVDFCVDDKQQIAGLLDEIGLDYIEGGSPGATLADTGFFASRPDLTIAQFTAFGMTRRAGCSLADDPGFQALLHSSADAICLVAKAWDYHVRVALGITNQDHLSAVTESVEAVTATGREAMIDCEHFFDGYKANRGYALDVALTAYRAGARWVVLCDTNGATLPNEIARIVGEVATHVPGSHLGIHTHNDTDNAVANTLAAVRAGCRQIQGTLTGLGARSGNASLISVIPTLLLNGEFADRFETQVTPGRLMRLTHATRVLEDVLKRAPNRQMPLDASERDETGPTTAPGIVTSSQLGRAVDFAGYEHAAPENASRRRRGLLTDQVCRSTILAELERVGIVMEQDDARIARMLDEVAAREADGYAFEGADASLELLARRALGQVPKFFTVDSFRVMVERRRNASGDLVSVSEAMVKIFIDGEPQPVWSVAEGNGPVNALDEALRKDLGRYQRYISTLELVDYKVRIQTGGTGAVTRVQVESRDSATGERWVTIGVSPNIVDASFEALVDSINYKLLRDGADHMPPSGMMAGMDGETVGQVLNAG